MAKGSHCKYGFLAFPPHTIAYLLQEGFQSLECHVPVVTVTVASPVCDVPVHLLHQPETTPTTKMPD